MKYYLPSLGIILGLDFPALTNTVPLTTKSLHSAPGGFVQSSPVQSSPFYYSLVQFDMIAKEMLCDYYICSSPARKK